MSEYLKVHTRLLELLRASIGSSYDKFKKSSMGLDRSNVTRWLSGKPMTFRSFVQVVRGLAWSRYAWTLPEALRFKMALIELFGITREDVTACNKELGRQRRFDSQLARRLGKKERRGA